VKFAGHAARVGKINAYKLLIGKTENKET